MRRIVLSVLCAAAFSTSSAAAQNAPVLDVRTLMTPPQFRATGLAKLSPDELAALNAWLVNFALLVQQIEATAPSGQVIESQIVGEFECWDGETIFRLDNGQIWQQSSYAYKYCYKYRPEVTIYPSGTGHKMGVEGVDGTISVRRIK